MTTPEERAAKVLADHLAWTARSEDVAEYHEVLESLILCAISAAADEARVYALRPYMAVQKILDEVLGPREEDGAGAGIEADVRLALERVADKARAEEREECCRDMCPDCNRREPLDPYMRHLFEGTPANRCRAERIRSRGGEPKEITR